MKNLAIKNGVINSISTGVSAFCGMAGSILIIRNLQVSDYGQFSYTLWLAGILMSLATLAFPVSLTKTFSELRGAGAKNEADILASWVILALLLIGIILVGFLQVWIYGQPALENKYLVLVACILIPNSLNSGFRSCFWGSEIYLPVSISVIVSSFAQVGGIVFLYIIHLDKIEPYLAAILSVHLYQFLILAYFFVRRLKNQEFLFSLDPPKMQYVRIYLRYFVPSIFVLMIDMIVWQRSEIFFLNQFSASDQVAYYNLAYTIFSLSLTIGLALINGFFPAISRDAGARDWESAERKIIQGVLLVFMYTLPIMLGGLVVIGDVTSFLYGPKMLPAVPVSRILLLSLLPAVITGMFGLAVNVLGEIWFYVKAGLVVCIVNIFLDIVIIPVRGAIGAAVATMLAQAFYSLLLFLRLRHMRYRVFDWKLIIILIFVALGVAGGIPYFIKVSSQSNPIYLFIIPCCAILYWFILKRVGFIDRITAKDQTREVV
jgi:O-antigen/teichoic acid export membrane protein